MTRDALTLGDVVVADSITKVSPQGPGMVAVTGSHGGVYPAYLAARMRLRGVVFSDAGVGLEEAGVAGLPLLDAVGMAGVAVDFRTASIGRGEEILTRGRISFVNQTAAAIGCRVGQPTVECVALLQRSPTTGHPISEAPETRRLLRADPGMPAVWALDSVSVTDARDDGAILITGSHGALLGDDAGSAIRSNPLAAVFNDAGGGPHQRGTSRLRALDQRGIAGATVGADTARIGDGGSTYETGVLSATNRRAQEFGARVGMSTKEFVNDVLAAVDASAHKSEGS